MRTLICDKCVSEGRYSSNYLFLIFGLRPIKKTGHFCNKCLNKTIFDLHRKTDCPLWACKQALIDSNLDFDSALFLLWARFCSIA